MTTYRTKTYIAGDWSGDKNLIDKLYEWNDSNRWALHFIDAHELTQARDSSLYCSIKKSLAVRLNASKTFILIVGNQTNSLTKGSCRYCESYNSYTKSCTRGHGIDCRSYIDYECEKAISDDLRIIVIYNSSFVQKTKCPIILRNVGNHINGYHIGMDGRISWNYSAIKEAITNER